MTEERVAYAYTSLGLARAGIVPAGIQVPWNVSMDTGEGPFYQELRARLDLFTESVVLTQYEGGSPIVCYEVSPDDVAGAFAGRPMATGLLPRDTVYYAESAGVATIAIFVAAQVRTLPMTDLARERGGIEGDVELPCPPLLFIGRERSYRMFALEDYPETERTKLYHAPFPNVHPDGRICGGNADFPVCTARTIHSALEVFFESKFNTHLIDGKSRKHRDNVLAMWQDVAASGAETYPIDDLIVAYYSMEQIWNA